MFFFVFVCGGLDKVFGAAIIYPYLWSGYSINLKINPPVGGQNSKLMINKKQKTLINFKKAQSLISKIIEMVEGNEYCINIMQQNLAVIGLLKSAHQMLMENHLNTCFKKAISSKNGQKKQRMINEILEVTKLFNR